MLLPLHLGGGRGEPEKAYDVLRSAMGAGGTAQDDSGIDGLWRRSLAIGIAAGTSHYRRAINNASPALATDLLPYYDRVLGRFSDADEPDEVRRQAAVAGWTARSTGAILDIEADLKRIDARFSCSLIPEAHTSTSLDGRWFGSPTDLPSGDAELPYYTTASALAGETTRYLLVVTLDGGEALGTDVMTAIGAAERRLRRSLQSWWGFTITVSDDGFELDVSPLDYTALMEDE